MKLSDIVAQLPEDVALEKFRARLDGLIKRKGDDFVSQECLEQIEAYMRGYIDPNFEFSSEASHPFENTASASDFSDDFDLPWLLRGSSVTKA
jgi:hypothetical protein